jgi:formylmethanofuran dehydrogenase subunit C
METLTITMKSPHALYLEADNVSPDAFAGKTAAQIAELHVHEGNVTSTLGKYFDVSGNAGATAADTKIIVKGDVKKVKYLGFKMSAGELVVEGSTDQYAGAWMTGGKMLVKGSVDAFAGTAMKGGNLPLKGMPATTLGLHTVATGAGCPAARSS